MNQKTFWSDTLRVCLSDVMESSVEGPYHVVEEIAQHLRLLGLTITRIDESHKGTKNINPRREAFINVGARTETLKNIEVFLEKNDVHFTKHESVAEQDHLDYSYDLDNISVWKNGA